MLLAVSMNSMGYEQWINIAWHVGQLVSSSMLVQ